MTGFSRGQVNERAAARSVDTGDINQHLLQALKKITGDIEELKKRAGTQAIDFDQKTPISSPPESGAIEVRPSGRSFKVIITNPEHVQASAAQNVRNPLRAIVRHRLAFSLNSRFDAQGDVRYYGPSSQTDWVIDDIPPSSRWVRLESSYDETNWNRPTVVGPFKTQADAGGTPTPPPSLDWTGFDIAIGPTGHITLPHALGDLVIQWITGASDAAGEHQVDLTWDIPFPTACDFAFGVMQGPSANNNDSWYQVVSYDQNGISLYKQGTGGTTQATTPLCFGVGH
jgi:hypothetical protein